MKIIVDSTNQDLALALLDVSDKLIELIVFEDLKQKVEQLDKSFKKLLDKHQLNLGDISVVFVCLGPGRFTGVRIGLLYFQSLNIFYDFKLIGFSSFALLPEGSLIDARSNQVYKYDNEKQAPVLVDKPDDYHFLRPDYKYVIKKWNSTSKWWICGDKLDLEPIYLKDPQIGVKKW